MIDRRSPGVTDSNRVVESFKTLNGQKLFQRDAVLDEQLKEIDATIEQRVHHRLVESVNWLILIVAEDGAPCEINAIPSQCQRQLQS